MSSYNTTNAFYLEQKIYQFLKYAKVTSGEITKIYFATLFKHFFP